MIPWEELDSVSLPQGGQLRLMRRGQEFSIKLGVAELMTSRLFASEAALATLAAKTLAGRARPRVLIGGLGMGFTLRAALSAFGAEALIVVAELVPAVVRWARGPMAELFAGCLDDRRVELVEADVVDLIRAAKPSYDAILLDVDNGPEGMTQTANDYLYSARGWRRRTRRCVPAACSPFGRRVRTALSRRGLKRRDSLWRTSECARGACMADRGM